MDDLPHPIQSKDILKEFRFQQNIYQHFIVKTRKDDSYRIYMEE
jgi:hypothetical protein